MVGFLRLIVLIIFGIQGVIEKTSILPDDVFGRVMTRIVFVFWFTSGFT